MVAKDLAKDGVIHLNELKKKKHGELAKTAAEFNIAYGCSENPCLPSVPYP